jgi:hypothetical protein
VLPFDVADMPEPENVVELEVISCPSNQIDQEESAVNSSDPSWAG